MSEKCAYAVNINQDFCSRCTICYSICPYEAITRDAATGKVEIDPQKCQVCGICYSACPVTAIEVAYYSYDSLLEYVKNAQSKHCSETLVLMCRGNSPPTGKIEQILAREKLNVENYLPLRVPCSGRIPTDFIFKVLNTGIRRVVSIQCEDAFCRFKEGTKISSRRMSLGNSVLQQFGLSKDTLRVVKYSRKAVYDTEKCVGCDKCVFICPYEAIDAEPLATPRVNMDYCMGCGACALVCPHNAIQVEGFEFEDVLKRYTEAAKKLKAQNKSPTILVFVCQWSEFSALDDVHSELLAKNAFFLEVPCFKALDPVHVVSALRNGFDGVMAVVCSAEDCKLQEGKETAERNMSVLRDTLKKMKLQDRFELLRESPRCVGEFSSKFKAFSDKIAELRGKEQGLEAEAHV